MSLLSGRDETSFVKLGTKLSQVTVIVIVNIIYVEPDNFIGRDIGSQIASDCRQLKIRICC